MYSHWLLSLFSRKVFMFSHGQLSFRHFGLRTKNILWAPAWSLDATYRPRCQIEKLPFVTLEKKILVFFANNETSFDHKILSYFITKNGVFEKKKNAFFVKISTYARNNLKLCVYLVLPIIRQMVKNSLIGHALLFYGCFW